MSARRPHSLACAIALTWMSGFAARAAPRGLWTDEVVLGATCSEWTSHTREWSSDLSERAFSRARTVALACSDTAEILAAYGQLALERAEPGIALAALERAVALFQKAAPHGVLVALGDALAVARLHERARTSYLRALPLAPSARARSELRARLADLDMEEGALALAIAGYEAALAIDPRATSFRARFAIALDRDGQVSRAERLIATGTTFGLTPVDEHYANALLALRQRALPDAKRALERFLAEAEHSPYRRQAQARLAQLDRDPR